MTNLSLRRGLLALCLVIAGGAPACAQHAAHGDKLADAPPGAVRVFASGSMRAPILTVRDQIERATGRKLVVESSESRVLQKEIEAGQPFEVALLTNAVIGDMTTKGHMVAGSAAQVSAVRIGVAYRGDAPRLDVSTPEGLTRAITGAHSIRRYFGVAASTPIVDNLFSELKLADATGDRIVGLGEGPIPPEAPLARGQYEIIINLVSAVIPMKGWTYVGLIPEQYQRPVFHSAAIGTLGDHDAGDKILQILKGKSFEDALIANGSTRQ